MLRFKNTEDVASPSVLRFPGTRHHKVIVISDLHFPRRDSHPKYLLEFLEHNTCDTLIFLGDTLEGYDAKLAKFHETHLRVWDLIARRKEQGVRVIDIPGNHDSYKRRETILGHKVFGTEYGNQLVLESALGRALLFHGDVLDGKIVKRYDKVAYTVAKKIKIAGHSLLDLHSSIEAIGQKLWGTKDKKRNPLPTEQQAAALAADMECQVVLMGHTHKFSAVHPVEGMPDIFYGNTGAWVGGLSTSMVLTQSDEWVLIDWDEKRESFYAKKPQGLSAPNLHAAFREATIAEWEWQEAQHRLFTQEALVLQVKETIGQLDKVKRRLLDFKLVAEEGLEAARQHARAASLSAGIQPLIAPGHIARPSAPQALVLRA